MKTAEQLRTERRERVRVLHAEGKTTGEIVKILGGVLKRNRVYTDYKALGLVGHKGTRVRPKWW